MKIQNFEALATSAERRFVFQLAEAGLLAIDTRQAIRRAVSVEAGILKLVNEKQEFKLPKRVFVVGVGKCATAAAEELETILGDHLTGGLVIDVTKTNICPLKKIECFVGTHPFPSDENIAVTGRLIGLLTSLEADDLVLVIVSGGGSTLLCLPENNASCLEEKMIVQALFEAGATIQELNVVRKHMSLARGGHLAKAAHPAQVVGLIFSDVPGDDLTFVASGPTFRDETTVADADQVLEKYGILRPCGLEHCGLIETPKEAQYFERVVNALIVSNGLALKAMAEVAEQGGFKAEIKTNKLVGEAKTVGQEVATSLRSAPPKTVHLYGGETTVKFAADETGVLSRGGRNHELGLSALTALGEGEVVLTLASDGHDNSDYAGVVVDRPLRQLAESKDLAPETYLARHDSIGFFEAVGEGQVETGSTGSNVSDLLIAVKFK